MRIEFCYPSYFVLKKLFVGFLYCVLFTFSNSIFAQIHKSDVRLTMLPLAPSDSGSKSINHELLVKMLPKINMSKQRVSYNQVLTENTSISMFNKISYTKQSRSFKMQVNAAALNHGVEIPVSSESPVIRVISMAKGIGVEKQQLKIKKGSTWLSSEEAFDVVANQNELNAAGLSIAKNAFAMKLKKTLGREPVTLKIDRIKADNSQYVIHVLEPRSDKILNLTVNNAKLLKGDLLTLKLNLLQGVKKLPLNTTQAYILSPQGAQKIPVILKSGSDKFAGDFDRGSVYAAVDTSQLSTQAAGLWEFHVASSHGDGRDEVLRNAKLAFSLAPKTGRLLDRVVYTKPQADKDTLCLEFDVEAAVAGRYEVSAIIYGFSNEGKRTAGIKTTTAQWLESNGSIVLEVPADILRQAGIVAPFEVRHLSLKDQTRMAELWSQEKALVIN